ncbi:MAG: adenosylmethionine--8-amino-7-oxononanoate transaminase [Sorangiineae bacterium]|nr:adenosylmethionine--8-amino-7-oxononanoate transaminase [Polyangiaceae bacterium]MEB2321637.1 adenosylmethionine--8-amino-7-oxononanoate transaminase [Sorangiineae bacterium]
MTDIAAVLEADRRHLWHPYTPMDEWRERHAPLVVTGARGPWLTLADGSRLIDGNGSWWVATLGHNHPRLVDALIRQAREFCHVSLAGVTHAPAALLARELAAVAPGELDQVFFSDDGSTAIEAAVKMSVQFHAQTGRPRKSRFLALEGAFHGETVGATSLGGVEVFRRPFAGVVFDVVHVPVPAGVPDQAAAFDAVARIVEREHESIAALVVEPILQGAAGMRLYEPRFLAELRELTRAREVLLIADEVFTGYGRLGAMWASELAGVVPDLLCVAKGFTAGHLPMAATITSQRVLDAFSGGRERAFLYGHSYAGNPLGAAVAREVLAVYRDERVLEGILPRAARIAAAFARLRDDPVTSRLVRSSRALGMMGAADLRDDPRLRTRGVVPTVETTDELGGYTAGVGWRVYEEARRRGAYLRPLGNVVYVCPPLNIPEDALARLLDIVEESVRQVASAL